MRKLSSNLVRLAFLSSVASGLPALGAHVADFNGDGTDDVHDARFRHAEGPWLYHAMDGRQPSDDESGTPGLPESLDCEFAGIGDMNLWLDNNQLTGQIPIRLPAALQRRSLRNNRLTGSVPDLSGLAALTRVWMANNHLAGAIPSLPANSQLTRATAEFTGATEPGC